MYTILIAEDELLVRMGIASSVPWEQMNMRVVAETSDGESALKAFHQYHPDIIITDIRMPHIDGLELVRKIREEDKDCAIIIVTNVENSTTVEKMRAMGVSEFLLKATMKRDDIAEAVIRARNSLPEGYGSDSMPLDNHSLWKEFLTSHMSPENFHLRCVQENSAYFRPEGFIVLHIKSDKHTSHRLIKSLISLFSHQLDEENSFCVVELGNDAIALARKSFDSDLMMRNLSNLARYIRNNFDTDLCFVIQPHLTQMNEIRIRMETALNFTSHTFFFDESVLLLDAMGNPDFGRLKASVRALHHNSTHPAILNAIEYMEEHIADKLSIRQVSDIVGYHPTYFSNLFKQETGLSYSDFLTALRIQHAKDLLRRSTSSLQEIADLCGFNDLSYFSNKFKHATGITPSQWRSQI